MDERATKKVVIDPGHGGADPGTIANGITEKDYTLMISKYMADRLNQLGIENKLTRDSDVTLDSNSRPQKVQSLFGKGNDVILVSNHINAGGGDGAEIIYSLRNSDTLSRNIANEFIKSGQNVRKYYQRRLPSDSSKDYYYILRNTPNNESIIVEYGFADSTGDDVNQIKNNWQNLAEAVVRGLANYIGVPYTSPEGEESNFYTVKKGDNLYSIARKYGVSVNELKTLNNLTSNTLTIGQVLTIPTTESIEGDTYIVQAGDSLYKIAGKYNMTVNELKALNNLTSNNLSIGQVLKVIQEEPTTENTYVVQRGDSLYSIARKFNISVDDLKRANNKTSNLLSIGEKLVIPGGNNTQTPTQTYTVKRGDTLWGIANMFNTTVEAIKQANNLTSNTLAIGMQLKV